MVSRGIRQGGKMPNADQATLTQVFEILRSLRETINAPHQVEETYVREFHNTLKILQNLGQEVDELPDIEVKPRLTSLRYDGSKSYSHEKYVARDLLLDRLDALLLFFKLTCKGEKIIISFNKSDHDDTKKGHCG
jgi:hypothetical protein